MGGWRKAPGHLRGRALQEWNLIPLEDKSAYSDAVQVLRSRVDPENRVLAGQDFRRALQDLWPSASDVWRDFFKLLMAELGDSSDSSIQPAPGWVEIQSDQEPCCLCGQFLSATLYRCEAWYICSNKGY